MTASAVGIVVALQAEARVLTQAQVLPGRVLELADGGRLWLAGMGQAAAGQGARALADSGVQALASFGVAGALDPSLRSGVLLCPSQVVDEHGRVYACDPAWCERLCQRLTRVGVPVRYDQALASVATTLGDGAAKRAAAKRYGCAAVDLESAAVAAVARECGLPFMALRAIVDERDDVLPPALQQAIDHWGRPKPAAVLLALLRQPLLLGRLPGLSRRMGKALTALRSAAQAAPCLGAVVAEGQRPMVS